MFAADDRILDFPQICERPAPEVLYLCSYKLDKARLAAQAAKRANP